MFILLDKPDEELDCKLSEHVMALHGGRKSVKTELRTPTASQVNMPHLFLHFIALQVNMSRLFLYFIASQVNMSHHDSTFTNIFNVELPFFILMLTDKNYWIKANLSTKVTVGTS